MLNVVDACLHLFFDPADVGDRYAAGELDDAMDRSRFAYKVDFEAKALVRVLPAGVEEAVREAFGVKAAEGHMRAAVHWATGVKPDPTNAFHSMVRALEAVVIPALTPADRKATLGKVLGNIRAQTIRLETTLPRGGAAAAGAFTVPDVVRGMLELVWSGYERHVAGGTAPTVDDVRALLGVAGSLVQWFGTGLVKKAP